MSQPVPQDLNGYFQFMINHVHLSRAFPCWHQITAIGELITLPLVVLVSFMAQPRLLFAMAKDGLLPHIFAEVIDTIPTCVFRRLPVNEFR